jgi:hypothetical protein
MSSRRKDVAPLDKITWYYRHWNSGEDSRQGVKNKEKLPKSYIDDNDWDSWMLNDPRNP